MKIASPIRQSLSTAFLIASVMLSSTSALAIDVTITDSVISSLRRLGDPGPRTFSETMACGQTTVFESTDTHCNVQCTQRYCKTICDSARSGQDGAPATFKVFTDECSAGVAHIFGENGLIVKVTEDEYIRENGFYLKPLLEQMGQYIQPAPKSIVVNWIFPSTVKRIVDGKMQIIPIDWLAADVYFGDGTMKETVHLWIAPGMKGAEQIIRIALGDSNVFMRLNGVVQGPTGF